MGTRRLTLAAVLATFLAACTTAGPNATSPSASPLAVAPVQPLMVGFDDFFKLDWQVGARNGRPIIVGHLYNNWGKAAANMRLLVEGLDATGNVTGQELVWLQPTMLTSGTSQAFEADVPGPGATYRVRVFAFDWLERGRKL